MEHYHAHVEACGVKTKKCEVCGRWVKNKDWDVHPASECKKFVKENEAKEQAEMTKKMEELALF